MPSMKLWWVTVALVISPAVTWAQDVHTSFSPSANFSSFRTYYWANTDAVPGNDIVNQRIMAAVDRGMAQRGWTKAPEGEADLAVVANVSTQERQKLDTFYGGWGWGGWGWGGWGPTTTTVGTYLEGTLVVDLFDASTHKLVWRGVATDTVSHDPQKNAEHIDKAVAKMFGKKFIEDED